MRRSSTVTVHLDQLLPLTVVARAPAHAPQLGSSTVTCRALLNTVWPVFVPERSCRTLSPCMQGASQCHMRRYRGQQLAFVHHAPMLRHTPHPARAGPMTSSWRGCTSSVTYPGTLEDTTFSNKVDGCPMNARTVHPGEQRTDSTHIHRIPPLQVPRPAAGVDAGVIAQPEQGGLGSVAEGGQPAHGEAGCARVLAVSGWLYVWVGWSV